MLSMARRSHDRVGDAVRVRHVSRDVVSRRFYIDSTYIHDNHTQKKRSGGEPTADAARQPAARPPHRPPHTHAHEREQAARTHSPSTLRPPGGRAQPSRALSRLARPSGPSSSATNRRRARRHALAGTPARHLDDARERPLRRRQEPQTAVKPPPGRPPPCWRASHARVARRRRPRTAAPRATPRSRQQQHPRRTSSTRAREAADGGGGARDGREAAARSPAALAEEVALLGAPGGAAS